MHIRRFSCDRQFIRKTPSGSPRLRSREWRSVNRHFLIRQLSYDCRGKNPLHEFITFKNPRIAPAALAASGVMFWLQPISFIPKAVPIRATCDPTFPSPRTPKVFPRRSVPTVCCQPPDRTELLSVTIWRAEAKISAQVNSIVGSDLYPV